MADGFQVIIPARYASARLPGKVLLDIAGKPMIRWVCESARRSGARQVVVATDDERVARVARECADRALMTSSEHRSGTDRVFEAARRLGFGDGEIVVNVQGDEPLLPPRLIDQAAAALESVPEADIATLCEPCAEAAALRDPNVVKVVRDARGFALYFSRAPIPWARGTGVSHGLRHIGLYAFRMGFLRRFTAWPRGALETCESLEQLRALEHGARILAVDAACPPGIGVDTEEDLGRVRRKLHAL